MDEPAWKRPNRRGTVQVNLRLEKAMAEWLRLRADRNDRSPGAELAHLLRPVMIADEKAQADFANVVGLSVDELHAWEVAANNAGRAKRAKIAKGE